MDTFGSMLIPEGLGDVDHLGFVFGIGLPPIAGLFLTFIVGIIVGAYAFIKTKRGSTGLRYLLACLRGMAASLILFLLLDPVLTAFEVHPSDQVVAVAFDDSLSMKIRHSGDSTRGEQMRKAYQAQDHQIDRTLRERFQVDYYGFARNAYRVSSPDALTWNGRNTGIHKALGEIVSEVGPERLAGIIVLSDGVEQGSESEEDVAASINVPVITALLPEIPWQEFEIGRFESPRIDFVDVPVTLDVPVRTEQFKNRKIKLELIENPESGSQDRSKVIQARTVQIKNAEGAHWARFEFKPSSEGLRVYTVRASPAESKSASDDQIPDRGTSGDRIAENNERSFLLDARPETYRIFYFSGRPNWENAFIRRALADERQLSLTSHIRISEAEKNLFSGGSSPVFEPAFRRL